jgi:hypothetical protein
VELVAYVFTMMQTNNEVLLPFFTSLFSAVASLSGYIIEGTGKKGKPAFHNPNRIICVILFGSVWSTIRYLRRNSSVIGDWQHEVDILCSNESRELRFDFQYHSPVNSLTSLSNQKSITGDAPSFHTVALAMRLGSSIRLSHFAIFASNPMAIHSIPIRPESFIPSAGEEDALINVFVRFVDGKVRRGESIFFLNF